MTRALESAVARPAALLALCGALAGCGGGAFNPYAAYERPVEPDADASETVAPASLRFAVSGSPAALDATEARLKELVAARGGALEVVDPDGIRPLLGYGLGRGGPFEGRDPMRLSRYEVRFRARIHSTLAPMRAVWVSGDKTTFRVGDLKAGARLVDEGLNTYRLVLAPPKTPSPLTIEGVPQRDGEGWTLSGAPPVKLYELRGKKWVRIRFGATKQRVVPAAPTRVRVFELTGVGVDGLLAELLAENRRQGDEVLSLSLDATQVWLNAEARPAK